MSHSAPLGIVLFVEIDEDQARRSGTTVVELADVLKEFAQELVPSAETSSAVALKPPTPAGGEPVGTLQLDPAGRFVTVDGHEIGLTSQEFELLAYLADTRRRAITRHELIERVWPATAQPGPRTVDVHVRRIRAKLGRQGRRITTLRGHGYRLD